MRVNRQRAHSRERFKNGQANRNVRHEMTVHDIEVHKRRAAALDRRDLLAQPRKIGRKDRRCYVYHTITVMSLESGVGSQKKETFSPSTLDYRLQTLLGRVAARVERRRGN